MRQRCWRAWLTSSHHLSVSLCRVPGSGGNLGGTGGTVPSNVQGGGIFPPNVNTQFVGVTPTMLSHSHSGSHSYQRFFKPLISMVAALYCSNMSGQYKGCQALICEKQPLALFVHCGAHCTNLVSQTVSEAVVIVRDAMASLQELGALFSQSIKCRTAFTKITESDLVSGKCQQIRPLCPTRWLVRVAAIQALVNQYRQVLECLEEMSAASSGPSVSARASGLLAQLAKVSRCWLLIWR